jgi:hypothetical protein
MESERNAVAILEAVKRLSDPMFIDIFGRLADIDQRYPTADDIRQRYRGSQDERDVALVNSYIETVACLAARRPRSVADCRRGRARAAPAIGYHADLHAAPPADREQPRDRRELRAAGDV